MRQIFTGLPMLLLTACHSVPGSPPDLSPVGDGLRFLGVALVVAVLVGVLGLSRKGGGK